MSSTTDKLIKLGLIKPPSFLKNNVHYEVMMGSIAYGVSDDTSDIDIYGFCVPPKNVIFPHLDGVIQGFGKQNQSFHQFQKHHIICEDENKGKGKEYDITIYNIVRYFQLCMENNPNMIDSLFVPQRCILHITNVGNMIRDQRHMFLHKGGFQKCKGYAYSQLHKAKGKNPIGKRKEIREKYGMDTKFLYHVVRLLSQIEQVLATGTLDLQDAARREHMKAIRHGEVSQESIEKWFEEKEKSLETLYNTSTLPYKPPENKIKTLLLNCLEECYGSLDKVIVQPDRYHQAVLDIKKVLDKV